ncbi:hypothetical protein TNCV_4934261 [Trichonephila clavipes]|nr:hypothetical protein TNCV_4934261 [Trichonephila clavipes]
MSLIRHSYLPPLKVALNWKQNMVDQKADSKIRSQGGNVGIAVSKNNHKSSTVVGNCTVDQWFLDSSPWTSGVP